MKTHGSLTYVPPKGYGPALGYWELQARPDVMIRIKRLFPRASSDRSGAVSIAATPEVARDIEWILQRWPLELAPEIAARLGREADKHRENEQVVYDILTGGRPHFDFVDPIRPARDYQLVAADLAIATGRLLLCDDLGLGKTMSGLLVLRNPEAIPALVVCPTHLPRQWADEIAKTLPWLRVHLVNSGSPYDPSKRRGAKGYDPDVLIMGYSKLRGWGSHLAGKVHTVIFDEAQELRRADSAKYMAAAQIADRARWRIGLTATPVYNYGGEIHNIFQVLAPDQLGSRDEFVREWGAGGRNTFSADNVSVRDPAALGTYLRDQGLMLRRTRAEVKRELPFGEPVKIPHSIESDGDVFERLAGDALDLAEMIVNRSRPHKELFKARGDFDWKMRQATGIAKAPYVADFVQLLLESEEKLVLFGWHRAVYDIWCERLAEHNPVLFTGSESPAQKEASKQRFLTDPSCRLFVMSLRSGAGVDGLQAVCKVGVFGELDWSPAMHDQCIGRYARDGQQEEALAYFLVSDHGSDPVMAEVLNVKRQQAEPLRDPDAALFEQVPDTTDRIQKLAEEVLANRSQRRRAA